MTPRSHSEMLLQTCGEALAAHPEIPVERRERTYRRLARRLGVTVMALADDGNAEVEVEVDSLEEAAQEYVDDGYWGEVEETTWISVRAWWPWMDPKWEAEVHKIALHPEEPGCDSFEGEHDWRSPSFLGGIKENPGVWGHGGGVVIREVCLHCGTYRVTDTWAQDMSDGTQGHRSVHYEPADDASLEWVSRRSSEEGSA